MLLMQTQAIPPGNHLQLEAQGPDLRTLLLQSVCLLCLDFQSSWVELSDTVNAVITCVY